MSVTAEGLPPKSIAGGPQVILVRCTKCNKGRWRVTEGFRGADESHFHAQGTLVSVYCDLCEQLRGVSQLQACLDSPRRTQVSREQEYGFRIQRQREVLPHRSR